MRLVPLVLLLAAACGHSEPFSSVPSTSDGPFGTASPSRLTYNSGVDSAASLTEDGASLIYLYSPGGGNGDRCAGVLPRAGGTQRWQLCDSRATRADSAKSFSAVALGTDGRLLYLQAIASRGKITPDRTILWLADSTFPFAARPLITFPITVGGRGVSWLTDAQWTGPSEFVARAGILSVSQACSSCPYDTTVTLPRMVRGTISTGGATLSPIAGTDDATFMAFAEERASIVQIRGSVIERVAATGGTPTVVGTLPFGTIRATGIGCRASECVLAVTATRVTLPGGTETRLYRVRLATHAIELLRAELGTWVNPLVLPTGGDVVLQSSAGGTRDLYLFKGLLP